MVQIRGPVEFLMGSPDSEAGRSGVEVQHKKRIGRTFFIGAKAVTVDEYKRFVKNHEFTNGDYPVVDVNWFDTAVYCNWLSQQEGIGEDQWCYEISGSENTLKVKMKENYLSLKGYRLPTEAEMEYVMRGKSTTSRYYGESEELLGKYGWYYKNSQKKSHPVAMLKPNEFGLFDVNGNVYTWCLDEYKSYEVKSSFGEDAESGLVVGPLVVPRVLRGGSFDNDAGFTRSAFRRSFSPDYRVYRYGFRLVRTY